MPRFGLFCSDRVLRVPKLTNLRIVLSILRASISETIFEICGLRRPAAARELCRSVFGEADCFGFAPSFCAYAEGIKDAKPHKNSIVTKTTARFV